MTIALLGSRQLCQCQPCQSTLLNFEIHWLPASSKHAKSTVAAAQAAGIWSETERLIIVTSQEQEESTNSRVIITCHNIPKKQCYDDCKKESH